jgi:hypothetical protein
MALRSPKLGWNGARVVIRHILGAKVLRESKAEPLMKLRHLPPLP